MIETLKEIRTFGLAYDGSREELQIAARNDFYSGFRVMKLENATGLAFGIDKTSNIFDATLSAEGLRNLEELKGGDKILIVDFEVTIDYDRVQPSMTQITDSLFLGARLAEREE